MHVPTNLGEEKVASRAPKRDITATQFIQDWENPNRDGRQANGLWRPHKSDEGGTDTVGWGHKLKDYEVASSIIKIGTRNVPIDALSDEDVDELQAQDMRGATDFVDKFSALTMNQRTALTSLVYNVGLGAFKGVKKETKTFAALKEYQATRDPAQLEIYLQEAYGDRGFNKSGGKISKGLVRRRAAEMKLSRTPDKLFMSQAATPDRPPRPLVA